MSRSGDTTLNLMVPKILQTVTIGPEGGKLETEDFSLTIHEGAFRETTELKLGIDSYAEDLFEDSNITDIYKVEGMPLIFYKQLKLIMKLKKPTQDSISVVSAFDSYDPTTKLTEFDFDNYHAKDSSGFLVCNLSPLGSILNDAINMKITNGYPFKVKLFMGPGGSVMEDSKHFSFFCQDPKFLSMSTSIVSSAVNAYETFCEILNINKDEFWNKYNETSFGSKVDIFTYSSLKQNEARPNRYCSYTTPNKNMDITPGKLRYDLHIDKSRADEAILNLIENDVYHYLYYLFPLIYYPDQYERTEQFWLHHAIAAWSEGLNSQSTISITSRFKITLLRTIYWYSSIFGNFTYFYRSSWNWNVTTYKIFCG